MPDALRVGLHMLWLSLLVIGGAMLAYGQGGHSNPWLLTWIPKQCCVTSDCCYEIAPKAVTSLPDDRWRINASGQVLKRTGWSPDGKYYRCACGWIPEGKGWRRDVDTKNETYCIFVPMQQS